MPELQDKILISLKLLYVGVLIEVANVPATNVGPLADPVP